MNAMLRAYIDAALFFSTDEDDRALYESYGVEDIAPETFAKMKEDCADFEMHLSELVGDDLEQAGHDFWLTRNRHGAGFWDGDWPEEHERALTDRALSYGGFDLYVGDDGLLHGE
jgi:hypothetical protein